MKKTKFTEQQIAFAPRQAETGTRVDEVCRKISMADATFYNVGREEKVWWPGRDGVASAAPQVLYH